MSVGRSFLPVPKGDSRYYLGSQECEGLLASLNESLMKVKIPFTGSGSSTLSGEVVLDLPGAPSDVNSDERFRVSWEFDEGYRVISRGGVLVRSDIPVWTLVLEKKGKHFEDVVWKDLSFSLVDLRRGIHFPRPVTHNGMINFHPEVPPGVYVPQFTLPTAKTSI